MTDNLCGASLLEPRQAHHLLWPARGQGGQPHTHKKIAVKAGVDPTHVNRYMLRHYMATRIRRVAGIPVPREQRAEWLGHADPKHRQTEWYEHFDPDYLEAAMQATDAIMAGLNVCAGAAR
jgi:integrase